MAASKTLLLVFGLFLFFGYFLQPNQALMDFDTFRFCPFNRIYNFGDSFSDTGNFIHETVNGSVSSFTKTPYVQTFTYNEFSPFGDEFISSQYTPRSSNGRLIIDYIANSSGLPFLPPYKDTNADFSYGVNFAVAGSTALPYMELDNVTVPNIFANITTSSLSIQLDWMATHFNSICVNDRDCAEKLENALFMVGEIGFNDYNDAIIQGKTMQELRSMAPFVVNSIMQAVKQTINYGAIRVVVPGLFPIGCLPMYKTMFDINNTARYDKHQCLEELNSLATYHNELLKQALDGLKQEKVNAVIVYGDYYNAYKYMFGTFEADDSKYEQQVCCGNGGKFNFNFTKTCGDQDVQVCEDPFLYMNWDGVHLTETANRIMAHWFVDDIFDKLQCTALVRG